jgi:cytochrome c biogenesis factor
MTLFVIWLGLVTILIMSLLLPLFNKHIYFGPSFFQASIWPLCLPVLAFMGLYRSPLISPTLVGGLFVLWFTMNDPQIPLLGCITLGLTTYGGLSCFLTQQPISTRMGHFGWHMLIASSVLVTFLGTQESFTLKNDETKTVLSEGKTLSLEQVLATQGPNYIGHRAYFKLNNNEIYSPELRHFPISETTHSQMSIHTSFYFQSAVALENMTATTIKATYYYRPFIQGVWFGAFLIIAGILLWIYHLYSPDVFFLALRKPCRKIRLLFQKL